MTHKQALARLRAFVQSKGSQKTAAAEINVSTSYLSDVLNERRDPEHILRRIGIERVVIYRAMQKHGSQR